MALLIAKLVGTGFEYFEIIVAWQTCNPVGAGYAHLVFRFGVVRLKLCQGDGPIEQACAFYFAIVGKRP